MRRLLVGVVFLLSVANAMADSELPGVITLPWPAERMLGDLPSVSSSVPSHSDASTEAVVATAGGEVEGTIYPPFGDMKPMPPSAGEPSELGSPWDASWMDAIVGALLFGGVAALCVAMALRKRRRMAAIYLPHR